MSTETSPQVIPVNLKPLTQTCVCCGKELPINMFDKRGIGYRKVCKDCLNSNGAVGARFKEFTSKELIEELRARGYRGKLTFTKVTEVVI